MAGTRDRIMTATLELFRRRGYNGTGLKDVTTAAQATTGSLYHFFPGGKAALGAAVVTESGAAYQRLFELVADQAGDPAGAVRALFDGAADTLHESDYIDVCPIGTVGGEVASADDVLRAAVDGVFTSWTASAAARFAGAGLPDRDARELATTVIAALEGGFILARCRRDAGLLRAVGQQMGDLVAARLARAGTRPPRRRARS